jgi:hypothetical protein
MGWVQQVPLLAPARALVQGMGQAAAQGLALVLAPTVLPCCWQSGPVALRGQQVIRPQPLICNARKPQPHALVPACIGTSYPTPAACQYGAVPNMHTRYTAGTVLHFKRCRQVRHP